MKRSLLLLSLISFTSAAFAQGGFEFGLGYTYTAPIGTMKQNISRGNGIALDFYVIPEKINRLAIGMDLNYTIYGQDKSRQEYTFSDGTVAPMDIIVNNAFTNLLVASRYYVLPPEGRIIKPYVTLKGGYSWFRTSLNIYDPDDTDHCEPVDKDMLLKDGTFSVSGGAGFHWDMNSIFKKINSNTFLFNVGANVTLGGKVNYMNTDADHHHQPNPATDVNARFVNNQTQIVHEHHVGYLYNSFVEMVEIRAGLVFRFQSIFPY